MAFPFAGNARTPGPLIPGGAGGGVGGRVPGPTSIFKTPGGSADSDSDWGLPSFLQALLPGMDDQGEEILGNYLNGGGGDRDIETPTWTDYMMKHPVLAGQIISALRDSVKEIVGRKKLGIAPISNTFHAEFPENSGFSGYAQLHGSKSTVGDFRLSGYADVHRAAGFGNDNYDIDLYLRFRFNDIVNPNPKYWTDSVKNFLAQYYTFGRAQSYRLSINWGSTCFAAVRNEWDDIKFFGYPSPLPLPIRPVQPSRPDLSESGSGASNP